MMFTSGPFGCDTSDMLVPHAVLRRGFVDPGPTIRGADAPDAEHPSRVVAYYSTLLRLARLHDSAEDAILWPRLGERAPRHRTLFDGMAGQHQRLDAAALSAWLALSAYRDEPNRRTGANLGEAICQIREVLSRHLDEEEDQVLPLASDLLSQDEWDRIAQRVLRGDLGGRPWLMVGLFTDEVSRGAATLPALALPDGVRLAWQQGGEAAYVQFMTSLRPGGVAVARVMV
jgi:hypothetical protein